MAAPLQGFHFTVRSCLRRPHVVQYTSNPQLRSRALSTSPQWQLPRSTPRDPRESRDPERRQRHIDKDDEKRIKEQLATVDASKTKKLQELEEDIERQHAEDDLFMEETGDAIRTRIAKMEPRDYRRPKKLKNTFLNENDPEPWEDDDNTLDDHDDISTLGHGELERHREMRHYARLAAWEMPLLSSKSRVEMKNVCG